MVQHIAVWYEKGKKKRKKELTQSRLIGLSLPGDAASSFLTKPVLFSLDKASFLMPLFSDEIESSSTAFL